MIRYLRSTFYVGTSNPSYTLWCTDQKQPTNQPKVFWPRTNEKTGVSKHCGVRACAECHAHYKWTTASQTVQPHRLGVVLVDSRAVLVVDPEVELRDRRESTTRPSQQVPESANVLLV
jgi:hypothetical protein